MAKNKNKLYTEKELLSELFTPEQREQYYYGLSKISIGNHIKFVMSQKGVSTEELSERTDFSIKKLKKINKGISNSRIEDYIKIARALEVDVKVFFSV